MNSKKIKQSRGRPRNFQREKALAAATQVFSLHGYQGASMADLARAMGMNPPSIYNAFKDKEGLFIEVLHFYHRPYREQVEKVFRETANTIDAMKSFLEISRKYHAREDAVGCLIVNSAITCQADNERISATIKSFHDYNENLIYTRLREGQERGDISEYADVRGLSRYLNGIAQGAPILARGQQSPDAVSDLLEQGFAGFKKLAEPK